MRFNKAYLSWRGTMLAKRLGGTPYQIHGTCSRGEAAPEVSEKDRDLVSTGPQAALPQRTPRLALRARTYDALTTASPTGDRAPSALLGRVAGRLVGDLAGVDGARP